MAGLIRYAVLNPYWNLPPDLIRERARKRAAAGHAGDRRRAAADPVRLVAAGAAADRRGQVDWRAVARRAGAASICASGPGPAT